MLSHARGNITADATWTGLKRVALGVAYARNHSGYVHRIYGDTDEDVFTLTADAVTLPWGSVRGQAEFSDRSGSDLDEASLVQIGDQPQMRHYDVANRQRRKFEGQLDLFPNDTWNVSVNAGGGKDEFGDSYFGLQESTFRVAGVAVDFQRPNGLGAGGQLQLRALRRLPDVAVGGVRRRSRGSRTATGRPIPPRTCTTSRCT